MRLYDVTWNERFVAKIAEKDGEVLEEVEEAMVSSHVRDAEKWVMNKEPLMWPTAKPKLAGIW